MVVDNLTARNTEAFDYEFLLKAEALAYDLSGGVLRAQMRKSATGIPVYLEWSTANGRITLTPVKAAGFVTFTKNPVADDTLTIGETVVTFVASGAAGLQVALGADLDATMVNLAAMLSASSDPDLAAQTYSATDSRLDLLAKDTGPLGNLMALAVTSEGASVSAPTLAGGGTLARMRAPLSEVTRFTGAYVYDLRFEAGNGSDYVVLRGGTLTFDQGVTRN